MNIVQVLFSGLGGHGSVAFSLVRGDRARAYRHGMVFYGVDPLAPGYDEACAELDVTYEVVRKRRGLDLASWRAVVRALRRAEPDVVILHSMPLLGAVSAFARTARVMLLVVDHLSVPLKKTHDWAFALAAQTLAHRTIVLTREFAEDVATRLGPLHRASRVVVIGNGIDVEAFTPRLAAPRHGSATGSDTIRIGMHGRFSPTKDHATILRAVAKLPHARVAFAGDGEMLDAARALTADLGVGSRVDFLGMLREEELPRYLQSLDVYVQSSSGEAMSTAVMQAMAAGLPVVASDVGGLRNMVRAGETGELFPYGDDGALVRILDRLHREPSTRERFGGAARAHAAKHFSQETMFAAYDALIASSRSAATSRNTFA